MDTTRIAEILLIHPEDFTGLTETVLEGGFGGKADIGPIEIFLEDDVSDGRPLNDLRPPGDTLRDGEAKNLTGNSSSDKSITFCGGLTCLGPPVDFRPRRDPPVVGAGDSTRGGDWTPCVRLAGAVGGERARAPETLLLAIETFRLPPVKVK